MGEQNTYLLLGVFAVLVIVFFAFVRRQGAKAVLLYRIICYGVIMMTLYLMLPYFPAPHRIVSEEGTINAGRLEEHLWEMHDLMEETNSIIRTMMFMTIVILASIIYDIARLLKPDESAEQSLDE